MGWLSAQCPQDKGESNLIEKANDLQDCPVQQGTESSLVATPSGDGSWGHFPSMTTDEDRGSRTNDPRDAVVPTSTC